MVKQAKLLFMHSIEYDYAPSSFQGIWTKNLINQGDRPLRNADNYSLPNPRTEQFKKSPLYSLPLSGITLTTIDILETETLLKLPLNIQC
jgi:hypothetical protein